MLLTHGWHSPCVYVVANAVNAKRVASRASDPSASQRVTRTRGGITGCVAPNDLQPHS